MTDWVKTAKVGDRVVCVDGDWPGYKLTSDEKHLIPASVRVPMINEVLTIKGIQSGSLSDTEDMVWLCFEEIRDGWDASQFRPLHDRKTDISVLTALLSSAPAELVEG